MEVESGGAYRAVRGFRVPPGERAGGVVRRVRADAVCPGADGRDHNKGFSAWMAGGGVKGGLTYGKTDDYGYEAVKGNVHTHDFHATILHLLGLDHEKMTFNDAGRDFRLTDVHGNVVKEIMG